MSFTGYNSIGGIGISDWRYTPSVEITHNFIHIHRRHTIKAGADLNSYEWFVPYSQAALPIFTFNGVWTGNKGNPGQPQSVGNAFADFLLGVPVRTQTSLPGHDGAFFDKDWELYVQDTWQATSKLMVYLGVRYANQTPWTVRDNLHGTYDLAVNKIVLPENSTTPTFLPFGADLATFNALLPYLTTTQALGWPLQYDKVLLLKAWAPGRSTISLRGDTFDDTRELGHERPIGKHIISASVYHHGVTELLLT
jgi:hypothetical protein